MAIGLVHWPGVIPPQRGQVWHLLDAAARTLPPELVDAATTTESP